MIIGVVIAASAVPGFLAGLFVFKVKDRWCPTCGGATVCCETHAIHMRRIHVD